MTDFILKKLSYVLSSQAGLALVGKYLQRININALVNPRFPVRSGIANSDLLKCYLAMLTGNPCVTARANACGKKILNCPA